MKRKTREQSIRDRIAQGKPIILWHQINNLKAFYVEVRRNIRLVSREIITLFCI